MSLYLRQLELFSAVDRQTISSKELGQALAISDAQVRKDLAFFGQFGHPGIGYRVPELISRVRCILGTDRTSHVLLVGAGNLGRALTAYRGFPKKGFEIVAVFDNNPDKIGRNLGGARELTVQAMDRVPALVGEKAIRMAILAVPGEAAQFAADTVIASGVRALLNFAPVRLDVPEEVAVSSVDLAVHLEQLSFRLASK